MSLIIEFMTRPTGGDWSETVALARYSGEPLSKAGVGSGDSDREAAQEAINSYFTRRTTEAEAQRLVSPQVPGARPVPATGAQSILGYRVESTPQGVLSFIREAIASEPTPRLTLTYIDAQDAETVRDIYPSEVKEAQETVSRPFSEPFYLVAVDCDKDEPRTFRLDRIVRLESSHA